MAHVSDTANGAARQRRETHKMTELSRELAKQSSSPPGDVSRGNTPAAGGGRDRPKIMDRGGGTVLLVSCFLGIFVSYFVYGLLQEMITRRKFGDEKFHYFLFLVGVQCVINAAFAKTVSVVKKETVSLMPYRLFTILAFTYVGAMVSSNSALAFISYPAQVLGKSAKPIPVLILGVLVGHRSYPLIKYLSVLLITVGVALFLYKDTGAVADDDHHQWRLFDLIGVGELLVFLSLTLDGLTGVAQDRLKAKHDVSALHMMYAVNVFSAIYLTVGVVSTGEVWLVAGFLARHPRVILNILAFSVASAVGQLFIFTTITHFGPLMCAIFTTTRKFFTILASVIIFSNPLLTHQWGGVALVFTALSLDTYVSKGWKGRGRKPRLEQEGALPSNEGKGEGQPITQNNV